MSAKLRQPRFPHEGTRVCTFPGHEGHNPLPATAYDPATGEGNFPVRSDGSFLGWCHDCQALSRARAKAEPHRVGTRPRTPKVELRVIRVRAGGSERARNVVAHIDRAERVASEVAELKAIAA